jgi:hypothetical protein
VDGTGSGLCSVEGFGIRIAEPSGSGTNEVAGKIDLREIGCEAGNWMELAEDRVKSWAWVLMVLSLWVLLPGC